MKKVERKQARHLRYETLEQRTTMAGNVNVSISGGDLVITGDNNANDVYIRNTGTVDSFEVTSWSATWSGSRTTINGRTTPFRFSNLNFTDDVRISLNGGNDRLVIYGTDSGIGDFDAWNDLEINTGTGTDAVYLEYVQTGGRSAVDSDLNVALSTGADYLRIRNSDIGDDLLISNSSTTQPISTRIQADIMGVKVADVLEVDFYNTTSIVNIDRTAADEIYLNLFSGNDSVSILRSRTRLSRIDGGTGNDQFNFFANPSSLNFVSMEIRTSKDVYFKFT